MLKLFSVIEVKIPRSSDETRSLIGILSSPFIDILILSVCNIKTFLDENGLSKAQIFFKIQANKQKDIGKLFEDFESLSFGPRSYYEKKSSKLQRPNAEALLSQLHCRALGTVPEYCQFRSLRLIEGPLSALADDLPVPEFAAPRTGEQEADLRTARATEQLRY